jgi:hypothetical protein
MTTIACCPVQTPFEIRFPSLFHEGRGLAFPCDAQGHVALDELSERVRENYLFARAMIGREYAMPRVLPRADARAPAATRQVPVSA